LLINNLKIAAINLPDIENTLKAKLKYSQTCMHIITLNTSFLRMASTDSVFNSICQKSDLLVPDGVGVILLLLIKYGCLVKKITGNDILEICLIIADSYSSKIAFVGSSENTLSLLRKKIHKRFPNVKLKTISPPMFFENDNRENQKVLDELKYFSPDFLFVSLGCPRQEKWLHKYKNEIGAKINVGIGAAVDFYAGTKKRAPKIFIQLWLEWLWRLLHEPVRLGKRYILEDLPYLIKTLYSTIVENKNTLKTKN